MTFKQVSKSLCRLSNINKAISDSFMPSCGSDLHVYLSRIGAQAFLAIAFENIYSTIYILYVYI